MAKKVLVYLFGIIFIFIIISASFQGAISLFKYPKVIGQSVCTVIFLNIVFRFFLKQETVKKKAIIIEGGLVWRVKQSKTYKIIALIILGIIQILILSYGYAPGGGFERSVFISLIIPLIISALLLT